MRKSYVKNMGAYEILPGVFLPDSGELLDKAGKAILSSAGQSVATSPAVTAAAQEAAATKAGETFYKFMKEKPAIFWGSIIGGSLLVVAGAYAVLKKK